MFSPRRRLWTFCDEQPTTCSHSIVLSNNMAKLAKRSVLKKTVYDPLGFLSPYTIRAKMLIQRAWLGGVDWDDPPPANHLEEWVAWFMELENLGQVEIPRCLKDTNRHIQHTSLQTFTDASEKAYAANVYSRQEYTDGTITLRLIASKTRLSHSRPRAFRGSSKWER